MSAKRRYKYSVLISLTILLIIGLMNIDKMTKNVLPNVEVVKLERIIFSDYVYATGDIRELGKKVVKYDVPLILSEVNVQVGDRVEVGDVIATVDKEQTTEKILAIGAYSSVTGGATTQDYQKIASSVPEIIVSTVEGVVETVSASDGEFIESGRTIVNMIGVGDLVASVQVSENKVPFLEIGQSVEIGGGGFGSKTYSGKVSKIYPSARKTFIGTTQETVVDVDITFDKADQDIKTGYTAKAKIFVSEDRAVGVIPYEAVLQDDNGQEYVYILKKGKAVRQNIKTEEELPEGLEVIEGITNEDYIIINHQVIKKNNSYVYLKG